MKVQGMAVANSLFFKQCCPVKNILPFIWTTGKRSIILESQLPKGMEHTIEKIAELEGLGSVRGGISPEEDTGKPPEFVTTPSDLVLTENSLAHFECRLIPVNDPSMRVEWFHNGKPLSAGSRIKTINDFGFVILEVAGVYQRDSGLYTCKVFYFIYLNVNIALLRH